MFQLRISVSGVFRDEILGFSLGGLVYQLLSYLNVLGVTMWFCGQVMDGDEEL